MLRRLLPTLPIPAIAKRMGRSIHAVYAKRKTISAEEPSEMSRTERVERMVHLTERIEQCRSHLKTISTER
jgi:hypothetical protein